MFSRIEGIDRLVDEGGHDARSTLLRVATDLFVDVPAGLTLSDIERYADLALPLLAVADASTRLAVAARLSVFPDAPPRVMERLLMDDDPHIIDEVIRKSCQINRDELLRLCLGGRERHVVAVAKRHDLDAALVRILAQRRSSLVIKTLIENINVPLAADVTRLLVERAGRESFLAPLLLRRTDVPSLWLAALYTQGDADARARLRKRVGEESGPPELPIPPDSFARLHAAAIARDKMALSAALARMLRLDPAGMPSIMQDETGELLALALLAAGCEPTSIADIMRFAAAEAVCHAESTIAAALEVAITTPRKSARRIVSAVADEHPSPAPLYEPHMAPSGTAKRGGTSAQARRKQNLNSVQPKEKSVS
jgi:uncharacterized protein (DUF2336 family)